MRRVSFALGALLCAPAVAYAQPVEVEVPEGARVGDVFQLQAIPETGTQIILVNGHRKEMGDSLAEGDTLSVFPPMEGG